MKRSRWSLAWFRRAFSVAVIVGVVVIVSLQSEKPVVLTVNAALTDAGPLPDLGGAVAWLNSA